MKFFEIVSQAVQVLQARGRVTYRVLKREFALDDESLEDLKEQLIEAEGVAADKDGKMLVDRGRRHTGTGAAAGRSDATTPPYHRHCADGQPANLQPDGCRAAAAHGHVL